MSITEITINGTRFEVKAIPDTPKQDKEGLWSDEDVLECLNHHRTQDQIIAKFYWQKESVESFKRWKASKQSQPKDKEWILNYAREAYKQSQSNTPKEELLDLANPNPKYSFSPSYRPKEEQTSKDYEIVSYSFDGRIYNKVDTAGRGETFVYEGFPYVSVTDDYFLKSKKSTIHSVRRIRDNEVFSVGDEVLWGINWYDKFKIDSFDIVGGILYARKIPRKDSTKGDGYSILLLQKLPSTKPAEQPKEDRIDLEDVFNPYTGVVYYKGIRMYSQSELDKAIEDAFNAGRELDYGGKITGYMGSGLEYFDFKSYLSSIKKQ